MASNNYLNFDLLIERNDVGYRARVLNSPAGQARTDFSLPFSVDEQGNSLSLIGDIVRHVRVSGDSDGDQQSLSPETFGSQLFSAIFQDGLESCLRRSLEIARQQQAGLRIRLRLDEAPELANLPWEYLYDPQAGRFLALSNQTPIVRYLQLPDGEQQLAVMLPLRILAVIADPTDIQPQLNVTEEWVQLQRIFAELQERKLVVLERLEKATLSALQQRLQQADPVHVFHFIGHGLFDPASQTGSLLMENEQGQGQLVSAALLSTYLHDKPTLRLAFLNSCEGARSGNFDPFAGIAQTLVQKELPAVIAMQYPVRDDSAIHLTETFYQALAIGYPADAALAEARKAIAGQGSVMEWGTPVLFMRSPNGVLIDALDVAKIPPCPYPGMTPFRPEDARFFFGREEEITELNRRLRFQNFHMVIGSSGSGKSSLVFAGLIPLLTNLKQEANPWTIRTIRPGATPLANLKSAVGDLIEFETSEGGISRLLQLPTPRLLLVIDQFEELFVQAPKAEQSTFITTLISLRKLAGVALVLTMRADFYPELMNCDLWPVDPSQRLEIAALRGSALRDAIVKPAAQLNVTCEDGLIERLLADAADEPGVLPLLQETMRMLWDEQVRRVLSLNAYLRLGDKDGRSGLTVAMASKADATLAQLPDPQQVIARRIFLRLVQFGEGRSDTRRQQALSDLRAVSDDQAFFEETLRILTDNRLLTLSGDNEAERKVDIAHEMLIVGWPIAQEWVRLRRESELTRRRLEGKANEWVRLGRGSGGLLDVDELPEAERWLSSPDAADLGVSAQLASLVQKSRATIEQREQEKLQQAQEMARSEARAETEAKNAGLLRRRAVWLGIALLLALLSAATAGWLFNNARISRDNEKVARAEADQKAKEEATARDEAQKAGDKASVAEKIAEQQQRIALANQLAASALTKLKLESNPTLALLLTTEAISIPWHTDTMRISAAEGALHDALTVVGVEPISLTIPISPMARSSIQSVSFSTDTANAKLWLAAHYSLPSTASGDRLYSWNLSTLASQPTIIDFPDAENVGISPDGKQVALVSNLDLRLWKRTRPEMQPIPLPIGWSPQSAAFSENGRWLLVSNITGTIQLWDSHQIGDQPVANFESGSPPTALAISSDGQWLAAAAASSFIRLWRVSSQEDPKILLGYGGTIQALRFSPKSNRLVSAGDDGIVRIWHLTDAGVAVTILRGHQSPVTAIAFAEDEHRFATADQDGILLIWDWTNPFTKPTTLRGQHHPIQHIAFSADQYWLVAVQANGPLLLWYDQVNTLIKIACQAAGRNLTAEEWRLFLGELVYHATCPDLPVPNARQGYSNQDVLEAFLSAGQELNQDGWQLLERAHLSDILFDPDQLYTGPDIQANQALNTEEQEVIVRKMTGRSGQPQISTPYLSIPHLWQDRDLFTVALAPPISEQVVVPVGADENVRSVAETWNRYGGLLTLLANRFGLDPIGVAAVFSTESKGDLGIVNPRLTIRFENGIFYHYWGKAHQKLFSQYFSFNSQQSWLDHMWRPTTDSAWQEFHGDQTKEWEVFKFARKLDETAAMQSILMGSTQIPGFNYQQYDFSSVQDMYAIQLDRGTDAHSGIILFFELIKNMKLIDSLRSADFQAFASAYNGSGQAEVYGQRIQQRRSELDSMRYRQGAGGNFSSTVALTPTLISLPTSAATIPPTPTPTSLPAATPTVVPTPSLTSTSATVPTPMTVGHSLGQVGNFEVGDFIVSTKLLDVHTTPGNVGKPSGDIVGQVQPNFMLVVLEGPVHKDKTVYWRVGGIGPDGHGVIGWAAAQSADGTPLLTYAPRLPGTNIPNKASNDYLSLPFVGTYAITQLFSENPEFYRQMTYDGVPLKGNYQIKFAVPLGTEVLAIDDGVIDAVVDDGNGTDGNYVKVRHAWGESIYTHLKSASLAIEQAAPGLAVKRGQAIAISGDSGWAVRAPFLGLGIRINPYQRADGWGGFSDPIPYFKPNSLLLPVYVTKD